MTTIATGRGNPPRVPPNPLPSCRSCGCAPLAPVLSLGQTPLANALRAAGDLAAPEPTFPLDLAVCSRCALVQITAARIHGCDFCVAGHTAVALKKAQLPTEAVRALQAGGATGDAKLDAVKAFTEAVIARRGAVADADLAAFRAAGYDERQALEVVLGISLATLCNFANTLAGSAINPELQPYAPGAI